MSAVMMDGLAKIMPAKTDVSNTRQRPISNTRQVDFSNTRQLTETIEKPDLKPDDSNTRQSPDVHLNRGSISNARQASDVHLKASDSNARQAINPDDAFNYETQLLRLETYEDKNGRNVCKQVVRFVKQRTGRNIGEITPELAEALKRRPGKGRTKEARAEAERNRLSAELMAKRLRRTKAGRRKNDSGKSRSRRRAGHHPDTFGSELLPELPDVSQHEDKPHVH